MIRQVALLSAAQALFQTASVMVMTVAGLAGAAITPAPELATLPVAAMFLGTAIGIAPASLWMARVGRRIGFVAGAGLGTLGGLLGALGIFYASLPLLCLGTSLVGAYQAFAQFYRFAAAEVATDAFRPRAISFVLAGGVVAAVAGPILGRFGGPLLAADYAGSFLILAVVSLLAAGLLQGVDVPRPAQSASGGGRPLGAIIRQPAYLVALFGAATGYGVMILAMTATPLAMLHHHHDLSAAATVIQLHVLGMFLPSFFTGALISRFGVLKVMLAGAFLLAGHVLIALSGTQFLAFASALVLLGVGWNFLFIGGTTLLTQCYAPEERARAQAANDLVIFIIGVATSLGAGAMLHLLGWQIMNAVLLPWLALAVLALAWLGWRERQIRP
ncbi:MFS transporter [Xanthobacter autotrophicus]|uniref:MFS transporter n=1 Tax=Xanthobacter autotrophicus TaxID=280 RepID=UPI003727BCF8